MIISYYTQTQSDLFMTRVLNIPKVSDIIFYEGKKYKATKIEQGGNIYYIQLTEQLL